ERLWSPQEVQDAGSMYSRLGEVSWRLEWLGLTHRSNEVSMLRRMAGADEIDALALLADVVPPVDGYTATSRIKGGWDFSAPFNRLVDAANPESETGRRFQQLAEKYTQSRYQDHEAEAQLRTLLAAWRDNDAKLHSLLEKSFLLREVSPLSQELSVLAMT